MKIKEKTKFSIRNRRDATIVAQKMILDHIRTAVEFRQWGYSKFFFDETIPYEAIDIPTYKDYEALIDALLKNEMVIFDNFSTESFIIPVVNSYVEKHRDGKLYLLRRPEDKLLIQDETPLIKCLAVRKTTLRSNAESIYPRFKSRSDFKNFLIYIRAFLIGKLMQKAIIKHKQQKREKGSYIDFIKKSPEYSERQTLKFIKNYTKQTGCNQRSKKETAPRQWIMKYILGVHEENYNKIRQRLLKDRLIF